MRETLPSGSEGGRAEYNRLSLPLPMFFINLLMRGRRSSVN